MQKTVNPVHEVVEADWKPSDIKCNYDGCRSACREAPPEQKPKGMRTLVNCLNKNHCGGDYGFSVEK